MEGTMSEAILTEVLTGPDDLLTCNLRRLSR